MGSYDGAEVCQLVGLCLLGKLAPLIGIKNVGLDRNDSLVVIHQANGPKMDRIGKDIIALFRSVENARRNRNRKVIWFNPPHGLNVKANISKVFLKPVRKHFPLSNKLSKIFNLNTIKISYS